MFLRHRLPTFGCTMSVAPHTILRPFTENSGCRYFGRPALSGLRASSVEAAGNGKELECSKMTMTRKKKPVAESGLEALYDDGFGGVTMKDYFEAVRAMPKNDGGPPRWFCPIDCGQPEVRNAPLMLFLPGIDGVGLELTLQHKSLGKVFEVRCLHIPEDDRTPFEGILRIVEEYVKCEQDLSPNRPIYITGDSFGGCLAISVAARNPKIDLVLILVNTGSDYIYKNTVADNIATFGSDGDREIGNPYKMALGNFHTNVPQKNSKFPENINSFPPLDSELGVIRRIHTLVSKLKLLKSGAAYANSHLHAVQAEVLLLSSGKNVAQSEEADRLFKALKNCKLRYFRDRCDRLLKEDGFNLLTVIKGASMYRCSKEQDSVTDFLPPTLSEFKRTFGKDFKLLHQLLSPVMLSTLKNGKIVRGLAGVPEKGPILFVGYHQLLAMEWSSLVEEFLREKRTLVRALAHSAIFVGNFGPLREELSLFDVASLYGAVTVSPTHMYRLFERSESVLLFPGGVREALHRKGEEHRLFWPDQPEFVRMAAKLGVTIIPFGCVGEDDFLKVFFDYNDQKDIPYLRDWIKSFNDDLPGVRDTIEGEAGNQVWHMPGVLPKVPGRQYFLFGKPIDMKEMDSVIRDKKRAKDMYLHIISEVEDSLSYLKRKREEDPYRSILRRTMYHAAWGASAQVPTFEV